MFRFVSRARPWEQSYEEEEIEREEEDDSERVQKAEQPHNENNVKGGHWEEQEDKGTPAALHKLYSPSREQRSSSNVEYHGEAAVEYGGL
ncbi:hypothetical protein HJFPF1_11138 [Paramyrothecium foliicola]|nr:hypothetical protein HJFPF1_11138 [Paramyrothecium foliicola]